MSGETDLQKLLTSMSAELADGVYVFATLPDMPEGLQPRMIFRESEGLTLILLRGEAEAAGLPFVFESRMITLNIHSSLDAIGFMARISAALAASGISVNPVSGYYHDHLFVPEDRAQGAMAVLRELASHA